MHASTRQSSSIPLSGTIDLIMSQPPGRRGLDLAGQGCFLRHRNHREQGAYRVRQHAPWRPQVDGIARLPQREQGGLPPGRPARHSALPHRCCRPRLRCAARSPALGSGGSCTRRRSARRSPGVPRRCWTRRACSGVQPLGEAACCSCTRLQRQGSSHTADTGHSCWCAKCATQCRAFLH